MTAKRTSKNQVVPPEPVFARLEGTEYFDVSRPVIPSRADAVREKLAKVGVTEEDVTTAVQWVRKNP